MNIVFLLVSLIPGSPEPAPVPVAPTREKVDLPGFEQGDLYVLDRLSNEKLVRVERSEWVFVAILIREGLDRAYRKEAIAALARMRKADRVTQILDGVTRASQRGAGKRGALSDLTGFLMKAPPAALRKRRQDLLRLATESKDAVLRRAGYAALVLADGTHEPSWRLAESSNDALVDFLNGVPLISDRAARAALHAKIDPLLRSAPNRAVRQAAIRASVSIPGRESETFTMLASLVRDGTERDAAIEALRQLPPEHWPKEGVESLLESVMAYLEGVDPTDRNTAPFKRARQLADDLASLLPEARGREVRQALDGLGIRVVTIRALPDAMSYDRAHVVVEAGSPIEITFENPDLWLHNLVIVAPGALQEVGIAAGNMLSDSASWKGLSYVPDSPKVLFATGMVNSRESETLAFVAPEVVGEYPYLCTYPGHWVSMKGVLHVVDDVDAWIAANPVKATGADPDARTFVQAWKLRDFLSDLGELDRGRSVARGRELFTAVTCVTCHRVEESGGVIGPELGEVARRLQPPELLTAILEPSRAINEKYRTWVIALKDGRVLSGNITRQDAETLDLVTDPLASARGIEISRDDIASQQSSNVSTMPMGLLNTLTREEVLDLLAYIRSGR
jgi:putative heme-binding domain-containing protein